MTEVLAKTPGAPMMYARQILRAAVFVTVLCLVVCIAALAASGGLWPNAQHRLQTVEALQLANQLALLIVAWGAVTIIVARVVAAVRPFVPEARRVKAWIGDSFGEKQPWAVAQRAEGATDLLVVAHAFAGTPRRMRGVVEVALENLASNGRPAEVLWLQTPAHGLWSVLSNASPHDAASQTSAIIASCASRGYDRVVLVGHSAGALLLKKAWLFNHPRFGQDRPPASGDAAQTRRTIDAAEFSWWNRVERFVFLAGLGSGWDDQNRTSVRLLIGLARLVGTSRWALDLRRGGPFIENMRIEWLAAYRTAGRTPAETPNIPTQAQAGETPQIAPMNLPLVVQLVGTRDDWLDSQSDLDMAASPAHFVFLRVEESGHVNIINFRRNGADQACAFRRTAMVKAMTLSLGDAGDREQSLGDEAQIAEQARRAKIKHAVVVLHGIRDEGAWASRFRNIINGSAEDGGLGMAHVHVSSERFPWIPMISFFFDIGGAREKNVRWLAEKYVRLTAQFPHLERISFIGHSYGTYVFANCLQRYAAIRFHNVFLAGSVLPRGFGWTALKDEGRFNTLCNAVASGDWIVALFTGFFEWLRRWFGVLNRSQFFSLGDAGFCGFEQQAANSEELAYLNGGHDAFLVARGAVEFAATFVVKDEPSDDATTTDRLRQARTVMEEGSNPGLGKERDALVLSLNRFSALIWLAAIVVLGVLVIAFSVALHSAAYMLNGLIPPTWLAPSLLLALLLVAAIFLLLNSY